jgi:hypothetical protein
MTEYDEVNVKLTKGDVITSKKGILSTSPLTGKDYLFFKAGYLGNGLWVAHEKKEVECEQVKRQ